MTIHNEAKKEEIAKTVIMPGDPLRAKYITEKFLDNYKLVNTVRNMLAYTGVYKGKKVTIMGSGMGTSSIGLYVYELYRFYDVDNIIRIGTSGSLNENVKMKDIVLASSAYSLSTFNYQYNGENKREYHSSKILNEKILKNNTNIHTGKILTSEVPDLYFENNDFLNRFPKDNYLAAEMEAFALFFLGHIFKKNASCLLTIVDSKFENKNLSAEERQLALDEMILLSLNSL